MTPHFLVATFTVILFFPQESSLKCRKRSQQSSSPGSPTVKAKACCLVSRQCVSVGQDYSSNPKSPGSTRDSQVWPWEERMKNPDGILFSMPRETERKVGKILEISQKRMPRETESTRERWKINSDTMKASRKYRSTLRRCIFRYGRDLWLHRCRQHCIMDPSHEKKIELLKNSELENIKGLFGITRMIIEVNSEVKNVFPADVASSLWGKLVLLKEQAIKWTKARVYVYSLRVMLGKRARPEDTTRRWNDQVWAFEDVSHFQRIARIGWRSNWLRVENLPRGENIGHSPQNSSRLTRKNRHNWKIQWLNNLHVNVQWHWTGKER